MTSCTCACHDAVCTRCACLHRPCGWACAITRRLRVLLEQLRARLDDR